MNIFVNCTFWQISEEIIKKNQDLYRNKADF